MPSVWTVDPSVTDPIDLTWVGPDKQTYPFWIKLRKQLTVGEERAVQTAGWSGASVPGGRRANPDAAPEIKIDFKVQSFARAAMYLAAWSLADDKRNVLPLNADTIQSLHPGVFDLIDNAITAHVEQMEQEKKQPSGESAPSPTSA